jgi:hypothetical protein
VKSSELGVGSNKYKVTHHRVLLLFLVCWLVFFIFHLSSFTPPLLFAEEYKFDVSETEKKPYQIGGYIEYLPVIVGLDKNAALYKLNYWYRQPKDIPGQNSASLQLEGSYERGVARFYAKTYSYYVNSYPGETAITNIFEAHLSLKPSSSFMMDMGQKTMNWGKGYAWTPAAFLDRSKDPNDPELAREGYVVASMDYTKSFAGPLKTFTFTPVILPVYQGVNNDFGEVNHLNFASKFYFLLYDTDIDFMFFTGGSTTTRYGLDFSRNITPNLEVHGESSLITNFNKKYINGLGHPFESQYTAKSYLLGLRYLTSKDTTYILEYYRNGTGFTPGELSDYFSFIDRGYDLYTLTGNPSLLYKAKGYSKGPYAKINPGTGYCYLRISQKEPFDILYFTPAITLIANTDDKSFSLAPELLYTGVTNIELRLRAFFINGQEGTDFGERQNDFKVDFRLRYYF